MSVDVDEVWRATPRSPVSMPLSPSPELLVVALSVLLVLVLVALTVGAQLQAHPATLLRVWRAASSRLCARQSGSWRTNLAESSTTPGKKARRTQRRRERRSAMRERHYVTAQGSSTSSDQAPAFGSNPPSVRASLHWSHRAVYHCARSRSLLYTNPTWSSEYSPR